MSLTQKNKAPVIKRLIPFLGLIGLIFSYFSFAASINNPANTLNDLRKMRKMVLYQLHENFHLAYHPIIENYSYDLAQNLLYAGAIDSTNFQFYISFDNTLNAFASADGIIVLTSELVSEVDEVSEVASVLAHEIGHINQSHISRNMEKAKTNALTLSLGILGAILTKDPDIANALAFGSIAYNQDKTLSYSRQLEVEADNFAIDLMNQSGFDAQGLVSFFKKLNNNNTLKDKSLEFLSTHPLTISRIAEANSRVNELAKNKHQTPLSLIEDDFAFYQALVHYLSLEHLNTKDNLNQKTANQFLTWLRKVNYLSKMNPNLQIADEDSIKELNDLIKQFPNARILLMIKAEYLLGQIETNHKNSEQFKQELKKDFEFLKMVYPNYYLVNYYDIWLQSIDADQNKRSNLIEQLLNRQKLTNPNYFLSPSILAEKIAEKNRLSIQMQWAKAVQYEIKNNSKKALEHYQLAKNEAKKNNQLNLAEIFDEKIKSIQINNEI